jgi:hypothetical protein
VNPFILLLKPMIAVGTYITKLIVAGGMVVAQGVGDEPPQTGPNTEAAIVRLVVSPEDGTLSEMDVQLPNGEFFQLSGVSFEEASASAPTAPSRMGRAPTRSARPQASSSQSSGEAVAMLASETGHTMRCNISLPSSSKDGSGVCLKDTGERYEFSL